tara:strand:+ start:57 stop:563 length:507 start_codon:yes stop_codon:yes gene_type:complete
MAGSLIQIATSTVTSAVSSVTLTGIDSDNVYMVTINNWASVDDTVVQRLRITKSGTAETADYDSAYKGLYSDAGFGNGALNNNTDFEFQFTGNATGETCSAILYLYNFNSSSLYSFAQYESVGVNQSTNSRGVAGGMTHKVASSSDGLNFRFHSGNIASGTFTLYKVV